MKKEYHFNNSKKKSLKQFDKQVATLKCYIFYHITNWWFPYVCTAVKYEKSWILGPIVQAALDAAEAAERKVKLYAVEKNPYAVVTLLTLKEEKWGDAVEVISSDMREWKPTEEQVIAVVLNRGATEP